MAILGLGYAAWSSSNQCILLQALGLPIEAVVELTYSLSEHGLMPAAIRNFVAVMSERTANHNLLQVGVLSLIYPARQI